MQMYCLYFCKKTQPLVCNASCFLVSQGVCLGARGTWFYSLLGDFWENCYIGTRGRYWKEKILICTAFNIILLLDWLVTGQFELILTVKKHSLSLFVVYFFCRTYSDLYLDAKSRQNFLRKKLWCKGKNSYRLEIEFMKSIFPRYP